MDDPMEPIDADVAAMLAQLDALVDADLADPVDAPVDAPEDAPMDALEGVPNDDEAAKTRASMMRLNKIAMQNVGEVSPSIDGKWKKSIADAVKVHPVSEEHPNGVFVFPVKYAWDAWQVDVNRVAVTTHIADAQPVKSVCVIYDAQRAPKVELWDNNQYHLVPEGTRIEVNTSSDIGGNIGGNIGGEWSNVKDMCIVGALDIRNGDVPVVRMRTYDDQTVDIQMASYKWRFHAGAANPDRDRD